MTIKMHIRFVFLVSAFIFFIQVEAGKEVKERKKTEIKKNGRQHLGKNYDRNHKEITGIKDIYEQLKEIGDSLKNAHMAGMTDEEKNEGIVKLQEEFKLVMMQIKRVLVVEEEEASELKHLKEADPEESRTKRSARRPRRRRIRIRRQ